jgi:phosphoribosyl 1,2-cyclic phosphate phosphodiesterase
MIKITFLGTGPAKPIPRPNCRCETCEDARLKKNKSRRTRSSVLIQIGDKNILIDGSPDFLEQIKRERIKNIDALLITHGHSDAMGGLNQLNRWLKKSIPIYLEKKTWKKLSHNLSNLKPIFIRPNKKIKILGIDIRPIRVLHDLIWGYPTLAYKFNRKFIYASDLKKIPKELIKYFKNIPILILDAAMYFRTKIATHLNTKDAINIAKKLKAKNLYLTQIGHYYPPYNKAKKEIDQYWKINKGASKMKIYLTYDGLTIKTD